MVEQDRRRWNFDFQGETPLSGRFQWEQVPSTRAAALYHDSAPVRELRASSTEGEDRLIERKGHTGRDQENCSSISNSRKCPTEETPARRKRTRSKSAAKLGNYARITGAERKKRTCFTQKIRLIPLTKQIIIIYNNTIICCLLFLQTFSQRGGGRPKLWSLCITSTLTLLKHPCAKQ